STAELRFPLQSHRRLLLGRERRDIGLRNAGMRLVRVRVLEIEPARGEIDREAPAKNHVGLELHALDVRRADVRRQLTRRLLSHWRAQALVETQDDVLVLVEE